MRAEQHATASQAATKVEDETDAPNPCYQDPHTSLRDFNDQRRKLFERQGGRGLDVVQIYDADSGGSSNPGLGEEEESDDELNGIVPAQHMRVSIFHDNLCWVILYRL